MTGSPDVHGETALVSRWAAFMQGESARPPDELRPEIPGLDVRPDLRIGTTAIVYIDGSRAEHAERWARDADRVAQARDAGFKVIRFGHPEDWAQTLDTFSSHFRGDGDRTWDQLRAELADAVASPPSDEPDGDDESSTPETDAAVRSTTDGTEVQPRRAGPASRPQPLPRNVEQILMVLEQTGPLPPEELRTELAELGIAINLAMLTRLPEKYADHLVLHGDGRIDLAIRSAARATRQPQAEDDADAEPVGEAWWAAPTSLEPLRHDQIVVLDIETTGLERAHDVVWQIAATNLGTGAALDLFVQVGNDIDGADRYRRDGAVPFAEAWTRLVDFLGGAHAVAGHRVGEFDLPFLAAQAGRVGIDGAIELPALDVHLLSLLVEPSMSSRTLSDLADAYGVTLDRPHDARADVDTTSEIITSLLDRVDADHTTWQLVQRSLARAGNAWARLIPSQAITVALDSILRPKRDPLVRSTDGNRYASADGAVNPAFDAIRATNPGFRVRQGQLLMAQRVAGTLDAGDRLVVEAPTGTGKSLAYLIPASGYAGRRGQSVVVATHTKVLQRQLRADAQRLRDLGLLPAPFRELQGVGNYLCTREIAGALEAGDLTDTEWLALAVAIRSLVETGSGTWDEVGDGLRQHTDLGYRRQRLRLRTSANSCERRHCEWVDQCPLFHRLDRIAEEPGIVSANHALIAAWARVADEGGSAPGNLLAEGKSAMIFDEAHNLEDSLTQAWTTETGGIDLQVEVTRLWSRHGAIRVARRAFSRSARQSEALKELDALRARASAALDELANATDEYLHNYAGGEEQVALLPGLVRSRPEFRQLTAAALAAAQVLGHLCDVLRSVSMELSDLATASTDVNLRQDAARARRLLDGCLRDLVDRIILLRELRELSEAHVFLYLLGRRDDPGDDEDDESRLVRWTFQKVPIEVGDRFTTGIVGRAKSVVLTSATLAVDDSFDYVGRRLGIRIHEEDDQPAEPRPSEVSTPDLGARFEGLRVSSPFNHQQQSLLVLTSHLPVPTPTREDEFVEEMAADQAGFLSLTGGKALTLMTSRSRMHSVTTLIREKEGELAERGVRVLVQGDETPARIADQFRSDHGTVVFGLASYWEGFDAPGETLSYLTIERPPYPHPSDPLVAARQRVITDRGGDPFIEYVVPRTAIRLAQGFGRLIRTESDRGAAMLYDRRVSLPTVANNMLLSALPTSNIVYADTREAAWSDAIRFVTGAAPDTASAVALPVNQVAALLEEFQLEPGEDPVFKLQMAASEIFGIEQLKDFQIQLMSEVLAGRDVLGFLPTGSGKSLVFQLPALLHPSKRPFVVVSPLVALIKDQVDELRGRLRLRSVAGITGRTSMNERTETIRDLAEGRVRLLYVSPERLARDLTLRNALARQPLAGLVVDEAHCISLWGHDFRPEFRMIAKAVLDFDRSPRIALTATAAPAVEADIRARLETVDPVVYRQPVDRADLRYTVRKVQSDRERTRELLRLITHFGDAPGIVYVTRRALAEELAWILRQAGVSARSYHAGMVPEQREAVQDDYLAGTTQVVVATKAFGMGVNKPDIKWVVHYDLPESLEAYAQEAGRAARAPGLQGEAVLLFHNGDVKSRRRMARKPHGADDLDLVGRVLREIIQSPRRGSDHVFDGDEMAERLGIDSDVLNVIVARLEDVGNVVRDLDCSARGHVTIGRREPDDPGESREFFELLKVKLKARTGTRRLIDFAEAEERYGYSPDALEQRLIDWSFQRIVTFQTTQRLWRVAVVEPTLRAAEYRRAVEQWQQIELGRLEDMITYAEGHRCRRSAIAAAFGDEKVRCVDDPDRLVCDVCAADSGLKRTGRVTPGSGDGGPVWHAVPMSRVADPEDLVDVDLVVLQAVKWATGYQKGKYGEGGLKTALVGADVTAEGKSPRRGLLNCPQFGALTFLRNGQRRVDDSVAKLVKEGVIAREAVTRGEGGVSYSTLVLTEEGRRRMGGTSG